MPLLFWGALSLQVRVILSLLFFHVSPPIFFLILFLRLVRVLKQDLFLCPIVHTTPHWVLFFFVVRLGSPLFVPSFPHLLGVFLMKIDMVSSSVG
jgi:hypothetical protein